MDQRAETYHHLLPSSGTHLGTLYSYPWKTMGPSGFAPSWVCLQYIETGCIDLHDRVCRPFRDVQLVSGPVHCDSFYPSFSEPAGPPCHGPVAGKGVHSTAILGIGAAVIIPIVLAGGIFLYGERLAEDVIPPSQALQVVQTKYSDDRFIRHISPDYIETDFAFIKYNSTIQEERGQVLVLLWYDADPTTEKTTMHRTAARFQEPYGYDAYFAKDLDDRYVWAVIFHSPPNSWIVYFVDAHTGAVIGRAAFGGGY